MRIIRILGAAAALALLAGCGSPAASGTPTVVAGFYPLAWAAERVGDGAVVVRNLTPAGSEPHDVELTPREVAEVQQADIVLYLSRGFQPAVEKAVADARGKRVDVLAGLPLRTGEGGKADPHVWLDPVLFTRVARRIATAIGRPADPVAKQLHALDAEYRLGLAHCARRDFVTSHGAFGYLAGRYRLRQIPITGIDPAAEPSPQRLGELVRLVRRLHITTIFFERLVSPKLADTLARETGAKTAVLDPIEGLTPAEAKRGADYLTLMRQNLRALREALGCR
jgi:zinc transport system substrate-binding protein